MGSMAVKRYLGRGLGLVGLAVAMGTLGVGMPSGPAIAQNASAARLETPLAKDSPLELPSRQEITQLPRPNKFPLPAIRVPQDAQIYLVNYTNAKIDYAVLGLTGESLLTGLLEAPEQSIAELPQLPFPLNLSLGRQDNGFMLVRPLVQDGDLYLTIDFAPSLQLDTNYININESGEVYLY